MLYSQHMNVILAAAVTLVLDYLLSPFLGVSGIILSEPVTILAVSAAVTGSAAAYQGQQGLENSRRMRNAQNNLEKERQAALAGEAAAREAARNRAASAGSRVGRGSLVSGVGGLGFGSGTTTPGLGAGSLFGN